MVKNIFIIWSMLIGFIGTMYAQTIQANFDVSYGIVGKIGVANAMLKKDSKKYSIDIHLEATGIARVLSGHRKERHISKGHMEKGLMVSDLYQVIKSHGNVVVNKEYWIDHKKRQIRKKYKKFIKGKVVSEENTVLNFYAKDDLLTLYFNLDTAIRDKSEAKIYTFKAVGAERQKGKVTVIIPHKNKIKEYKETLGDDSAWYATAVIHQKIFSSKEGRLLLGVGKDGITNRAVLKDLILFGDITAQRTK
jgi:hypothetical protein